jgi:hypothetical protein
MWPDVTGMPTVAQAKAMVSALYTMDYEQFGSVSIDAPTKALKAGLYAVNLASDKQFEEATFFNPAFNASHTAAAAEAGYTALIEKSAGSVRKFLASKAAVLVGYCRGFNDTRTVDGIAVQTTNGAQLIMRADHTEAATTAILKRAADQEGHYVIFVSLTGRGSAETAHYRVAAITRMMNACTTVPSALPPIPVSVPC